MNSTELKSLLEDIKNNKIKVEDGIKEIQNQSGFGNMDFAMIDNNRELRVGYPEVIYGEGKTDEQVAIISQHMSSKNQNVLITRARESMFKKVVEVCKNAQYNPLGRTIVIENKKIVPTKEKIAIVAAGTSDLPVVEEAYETAKIMGNSVEKIVDVGVAGIHRLFNRLDQIKEAKVIIVVAGMEGALASVLGGLVNKPIIAVPTSVGYGANLNGITTLLAMITSCASGITVVNIDNGFGAAYSASIINQLK